MNLKELINRRDILWSLRYTQMKWNRSSDNLSSHEMYGRWRNMLDRCYNPNSFSFPLYGARGINVCEHWMSLKNFIKDLGDPEGLTLDRIDPDEDYTPKNCRWASRKIQTKNIRPEEKIKRNIRHQFLMNHKRLPFVWSYI